MRTSGWWVRGAFVVALLLGPRTAAASAGPPRDAAFETRIQDEIETRDPAGAALFARATRVADGGDAKAARDLFEQVHQRDPWFVHATRRLCGVESSLGHHEQALALCREAYAADDSGQNAAAYAVVLLVATPSGPDYGTRALELAKTAVAKLPDDVYAQAALCQAAIRMNDSPDLARCAADLRRVAPLEMGTLYFSAIDEGTRGDLNAAGRDLERARAAGLPEGAYAGLRRSLDAAQPPIVRYGWPVLVVAGAWLVGFVALLAAGALLSAAAMRAARRLPSTPTGHATGADAVLRRAYRVVLLATCAYYYVSLPLVAASGLLLFLGVLYGSVFLGRVPIGLLVTLALLAFASARAMVRGLAARRRDEEPGEKLDLGLHPELRAVLDEVAAKIGTRPVDSVYMTPGTDVAVFERGGLLRQVRGRAERCLVIGAGVLPGLRVRELKAILAHEYGHFSNEDTAGGDFALAVRRSLTTLAIHLVQGRAASPLNPTWWFVRGFFAVFLRISQGASRLQEVLADRWAAFAYGSAAFARGLEHVIRQSKTFDAHVTLTLKEVVPARTPLVNLYSFVPQAQADLGKIDDEAQAAMTRPASAYDSHPRPADRIAWVERLAAAGPAEDERDAREGWSLLSDRADLEVRMTTRARANLATRGVEVRGAP